MIVSERHRGWHSIEERMSQTAPVEITISEKTLSWAWLNQCLHRERLAAAGGCPLQVLYPGRLNSEDGPDFRGVIAVLGDGRLLEGDVELHLRSSDWQAHGHHRDPRYNGVALHVVVQDDRAGAALRADGQPVLTLEVARALAGTADELSLWAGLEQMPDESCGEVVARLGVEQASAILEAAGEHRFRLRADFFDSELDVETADQALYAGIMEALGYSRNKAPFRRLAGLMPLSVLEGYVQGKPAESRVPVLQALLMGAAGLLPEGGPLESLLRTLSIVPAMDRGEWRLFRVRPENHPVRRLTAAGPLVDRWLQRGAVHSLLPLVAEGWQALEEGLMVLTPGSRDKAVRVALVGRARAREIAVNVVLPFARAWARRERRQDVSRAAGKLYRSYPALEDNRVTREMTLKLMGRDSYAPWRTACRQQGLIHIQRTCCDRFRCSRCPLV
ncbi:MAG: DUF2851 family protein, partial [Dehalococcoidia bacterium]|nr:DUF2851 family protein [Dehalococcoidia bacterium]